MREIKYVLLKDVIIKKGTILGRAPNERGGLSSVECCVEMGKNSSANFNCSILSIEDMPENLIKLLKK